MPSHGRIFRSFCYLNFMKFPFLGFHVVVLVKTFHWCINYQCRTDIDEAKVISALRHKSKFEFQTFLKQNSIFWVFVVQYSWRPFYWCINYWCRTDIDEARVISFLGVRTDGQTVRVLESSYGNMSAHKKFQLKTSG